MWKALIRLVEKWGCHHQWKEYRETSVHKDGDKETMPIRIEVTMICSKCGKFHQLKV